MAQKIFEFDSEEFPNTGGLPDDFVCPECQATEADLEEVPCTPEEIKSHFNCGRSYACCCVAIKCNKCGVRIRARRAAPELEWSTGYWEGDDE